MCSSTWLMPLVPGVTGLEPHSSAVAEGRFGARSRFFQLSKSRTPEGSGAASASSGEEKDDAV